jgi:NADP-dependent 3-hydroxy acid dehydrogenase YdfG
LSWVTAPPAGAGLSPLDGKHALVTGASRGIGRAIAEALASAGARVTLVARDEVALREVAASIGASSAAIGCDLTDAMAVAGMVDALAAADAMPNMLVNNAGLFPLASLDVMDPVAFERTVQSNLVAPFYLLRAILPHMKAHRSGHIVNIGSVADRSIFTGNGAYSASKFGFRAMHEVLSQELRGTGVRSTLVSPAATDTSAWDPVDPDNTPGFPKRASMLRPADVADVVLWAVTRPLLVNVDEVRLSRS